MNYGIDLISKIQISSCKSCRFLDFETFCDKLSIGILLLKVLSLIIHVLIKASLPRAEFGKKLIGKEQRGGAAMSWMNERKRIGPKSTELLCSLSVGSCTNGAQGRQN